IHLTAWGGSGGNGGARPGLYAAPGGLGAEINLDAAVDPGETLLIQVGGRGEDAPGQSAGVGGVSAGGESGGPGGTVNTAGDGTAGGGGGAGTVVVDSVTGARFAI